MADIDSFYSEKLKEFGFVEATPDGAFSPIGKLFKLPEEYGEGFYWIYHKKDFYDIKLHDFYLKEDIVLDVQPTDWLECFNISYCESVSGQEVLTNRNMADGCITTFFGGEQQYKAVVHKDTPIRCIGIEILPSYYEHFLKEAYGNEYVNPKEALRSIDPTIQFPEMVSIMRQIWNYRGDGMSAQLFYDSKISEAISLIVTYNKNHSAQKERTISNQDKELITRVATYISESFNQDITLEKLSHIACMGTTKLKTCFKQIYGCTITEFIKQRRLLQAEGLLLVDAYTVEHVAKMVGYSNPGRFAKDFKNSTGKYPAEFRNEKRRS